ncbi:MAG TPA: GMC oxidoreductase [Saprospiraceae bacterium]|jgi:cholesterol oxidase|nr:GMC family oxidoreductase [Saprospiraceae bacterium]HRO07672.1 GMC oxidoreductase [Saprospiraceae bacterium]HRP40954.1 GMC oxidoreductase [Saprospiraceae bacterium]
MEQSENMETFYDYIIIGSGFGGSVSALRLSEKGYKVLVVEQGKWFKKPEDFPKSNWNLPKWLWMPRAGMKGIFRMTFFRHVVALSGVGVGGGSLVYANTLPVPQKPFYTSGNWKGLADWEKELEPFYRIASKMLGATSHPYRSLSDQVMEKLSENTVGSKFDIPKVSVYFGRPNVKTEDPYFDGNGPNRTGCNQCGGCMLGCRYNAKNTLDKNYLHLAQRHGAGILAEQKVIDVIPIGENGCNGYDVIIQNTFGWVKKKRRLRTKGVIFSGGVVGTVPLLLQLKSGHLSNLSGRIGHGIRTNSESLIGVTTYDRNKDFSKGIAIGSIVQVDENTHIEPVKYAEGSGIFRLLMAPMVDGKYFFVRIFKILKEFILHPWDYLRVIFTDDWSKRTIILLYMESIDSTIKMIKRKSGFINTAKDAGNPPAAFNPKAQHLARKVEKIINGKAMVLNTEAVLGIPATAHILGGACMGADIHSGVIDKNNNVFGYDNMLVLDGSMISANPGVNPSLSITAIAERAMSLIPSRV